MKAGDGKVLENEKPKAPAFLPRLGWGPMTGEGRGVWGHGSRTMESSESLFPFLGNAGNLYPRENPTIEFFKEAGSRRQQGRHPGTAQSLIAHPQSPQDPQPDPQFPPAASPPKQSRKKQAACSKGRLPEQ